MHPKDAKSISELIELGPVEDLVAQLEAEISPLKIEADSYEALFDAIRKLRINWVPFLEGPFLSEQKKYIYLLTKLEGKERNVALGITEKHYEDKAAAKKWFKKIANHVHPDKGGDDKAFVIAKGLYDVMVDD